jgi:cell division inhibitor SepF
MQADYRRSLITGRRTFELYPIAVAAELLVCLNLCHRGYGRKKLLWDRQSEGMLFVVACEKGFPVRRAKTVYTMALRDRWHRTMVYFGLAEDDERYQNEYPGSDLDVENEYDGRYRDRANVRRLHARNGHDDIDDLFSDDQDSSPRTRVLRPVAQSNGRSEVQVHLVVPNNFNDAQQVADHFKDSVPVILNLQTTDNELAKRLIDFASGLTYALDGGMQRIADKVFLLTPQNVEVSAEERAQLIEKGFFNQS